jgi:ABC transporter DrrB family efflux protein
MSATLVDVGRPDPRDAALGAGPIGAGSAVDRLRAWCRDTVVLARRNLLHVAREPMQLSDVTIQPVLFTVLFVYVFGAAMALPGGGSYKDFALAGVLVMNLTTSSVGTAVGLTSDLRTGVIDRFRTLPMSRTTILAGRAVSDLLAATVCATIVGLTGLAIGWRPDAGPLAVLAGFLVAILFGFAVSWVNACLGLGSDDPESAQATAFLVIFPLAFVSNVFAPTQGMPTVLRVAADWNPVSAVAGAVRELWGNPNPSALSSAWPNQHPVAASLAWSALILAVCVPLAARRFRTRTTD